jgi:hypothetical protein
MALSNEVWRGNCEAPRWLDKLPCPPLIPIARSTRSWNSFVHKDGWRPVRKGRLWTGDWLLTVWEGVGTPWLLGGCSPATFFRI